jgi:hypothetical protein
MSELTNKEKDCNNQKQHNHSNAECFSQDGACPNLVVPVVTMLCPVLTSLPLQQPHSLQ